MIRHMRRTSTVLLKVVWVDRVGRAVLMALFRSSFAGILSAVASLALSFSMVSAAVPVYCTNYNNGMNYPSASGYWYAQVQTASGDTPVYQTEGAKGNITTGGNPAVYNTGNQHVAAYLSTFALENTVNTCGGPGGCWTQVGWLSGVLSGCSNDMYTGSAVDVFVEIYDDSAAPCTVFFSGSAPSIASYDARYYTQLSNGMYRYQVFYEAPGTGNIQDLAYGDYTNLKSAEVAAGEAETPEGTSGNEYCPVLGNTPSGHWNVLGQPGTSSQNLFASYLNLYLGYWVNWTSSVVTTDTHVDDPYQIQVLSPYTEAQNGGPHS